MDFFDGFDSDSEDNAGAGTGAGVVSASINTTVSAADIIAGAAIRDIIPVAATRNNRIYGKKYSCCHETIKDTLSSVQLQEMKELLKEINTNKELKIAIDKLLNELLRKYETLYNEFKEDINFTNNIYSIDETIKRVYNQMKQLIYSLIELIAGTKFKAANVCQIRDNKMKCTAHCAYHYYVQKKILSYSIIVQIMDLLEYYDIEYLIFWVQFVITYYYCPANIVSIYRPFFYLTDEIKSSSYFDTKFKETSVFNIILIYFYYILNDDPKYLPLFKKIINIIMNFDIDPNIMEIVVKGIIKELKVLIFTFDTNGNKYKYMLYLFTQIIYKYNFPDIYIKKIYNKIKILCETRLNDRYPKIESEIIFKKLEQLECATLCSPNRVAWMTAVMRFSINK